MSKMFQTTSKSVKPKAKRPGSDPARSAKLAKDLAVIRGPISTGQAPKPDGQAMPLSFPTASELRAHAAAAQPEAEEISAPTEEIACIDPIDSVGSLSTATGREASPAITPAATKETPMDTITLVLAPKQRKSKTIVMYNIEGRVGQVQVLRSLVGDAPADRLELAGTFIAPRVAKAKIVETGAERKARLAALPKLTLAEKVAKAEERVAKMRAKLGAGAQPEFAGAGM